MGRAGSGATDEVESFNSPQSQLPHCVLFVVLVGWLWWKLRFLIFSASFLHPSSDCHRRSLIVVHLSIFSHPTPTSRASSFLDLNRKGVTRWIPVYKYSCNNNKNPLTTHFYHVSSTCHYQARVPRIRSCCNKLNVQIYLRRPNNLYWLAAEWIYCKLWYGTAKIRLELNLWFDFEEIMKPLQQPCWIFRKLHSPIFFIFLLLRPQELEATPSSSSSPINFASSTGLIFNSLKTLFL